MVEYAKQIAPVVDLCNTLSSSSNSSGSITTSSGLRDKSASVPGVKTTSTSSSRMPYNYLLEQYYQYIHTTEQHYHTILLPTPPYHSCWSAPIVRTGVQLTTEVNKNNIPTSLAVQYTPVDELLVAEHLLQHISTSIGTKNIRLTHNNNSEHVMLPNCLNTDEVHHILQIFRELYIQHESIITQRIATKHFAERAKNTTNTTSSTATNKTMPAALESEISKNMNINIVSEKLSSTDEISIYETPIVTRNSINTSNTLSPNTYNILKQIDIILCIDMTCNIKEYITKVIGWVSDDLQLLYEVTKPGDYAFSAVHRYYCPHHPWEVCILFSLLLLYVYYYCSHHPNEVYI